MRRDRVLPRKLLVHRLGSLLFASCSATLEGMASSYPILHQGAPLLRQPASPLPLPSSLASAAAEPGAEAALQALIDDLIALTLKHNGVGIAAPQVGLSQRLIIVASRPNERYPDAPLMAPVAMINPQLRDRSDAQVYGWEGCLSVPGQRGWVPRAQTVELDYWDRWGRRQRQQLSGFIARIFQHELDHLDGVLFPDRVERPEDLVSEIEFLQRLGRRSPGAALDG